LLFLPPQNDNGMRRAWSVTRLAAQREAALRGCGGSSNAVDTLGPRRLSATTPIHKDPSLAAMLLGEVAEVC
jgi:hypothetical protein